MLPVVIMMVGSASAPTSLPLDLNIPTQLVVGWDLNLEGGFGGDLTTHRGVPLGRVRAGVLLDWSPWFLAIGATYEITPLALASFGVQAEGLHTGTGFWAQLGGSVSTTGRGGAMVALGWSVVGVEGQVRAPDWLLLAKLRVPVEFIVRAIQR